MKKKMRVPPPPPPPVPPPPPPPPPPPVFSMHIGGSRGGTGCPDPTEKSQVAIGFLRNTSTDPPREKVSNCFWREFHMALCVIKTQEYFFTKFRHSPIQAHHQNYTCGMVALAGFYLLFKYSQIVLVIQADVYHSQVHNSLPHRDTF